MQIPTCENWCGRVSSLPQDSQGLSGPVGSLVAPLHWQSGLRIQSILWRQSARPILYSLPGGVLHTHLQTQCHSGGQYEERSVHVEFSCLYTPEQNLKTGGNASIHIFHWWIVTRLLQVLLQNTKRRNRNKRQKIENRQFIENCI